MCLVQRLSWAAEAAASAQPDARIHAGIKPLRTSTIAAAASRTEKSDLGDGSDLCHAFVRHTTTRR